MRKIIAMKIREKLLLCLLLWSTCLVAQEQTDTIAPVELPPIIKDSLSAIAQEYITKDGLKAHLEILASNEYEGRETGLEGQKKAAAYIANYFDSEGLPKIFGDTSYYQPIAFTSNRWSKIELTIKGEKQRPLWNYYSYPSLNTSRDSFATEQIVFLGFGIDDERYSDYKEVDVKGKTILVFDGEPMSSDSTYWVSGAKVASDWSTDFRKKLKAAKQHGVATILIIDRQFQANLQPARKLILNTRLQIGAGEQPEKNYANNFFITSDLAKMIMGDTISKVIALRDQINSEGKPHSFETPTSILAIQKKRTRQVLGENVLGYIEGIDPERKEELVVLTAHYDHIGMKGETVFNGADDNGSGTCGVLEICEALLEAKKKGFGPRRSVLVMLVSGEEKGLLGSEYYAKNPIFPLENTIANVNVDMIGRSDKKHEADPRYIYVIGADRLSTTLHDINEQANLNYTQLELDYTYNDENDPNRYYYRSDHYNFAKKGIPAVFYFSGTHPDYHRPSDTEEKILYDKYVEVAHLIFYTVWELANRDERIQVNVKQ
ncbi:MAG: M28 family peptidase [Bacteroidota bacterium]